MNGENGKQAIILLGHGSRIPGAGKDMDKIAARLGEEPGCDVVEVCFLSRLGPHLPGTIKKCVDEGAGRIVVIPYFLHEGLHIRVDIPEEMRAEALKYPGVEIVLGKHLGYDDALADLVCKRVGESGGLPDIRNVDPEPRENFPVPPGQCEFVPMPPEEAEKYKHEGHHH
jgi:sirohydrochlorin ferrochelatase